MLVLVQPIQTLKIRLYIYSLSVVVYYTRIVNIVIAKSRYKYPFKNLHLMLIKEIFKFKHG